MVDIEFVDMKYLKFFDTRNSKHLFKRAPFWAFSDGLLLLSLFGRQTVRNFSGRPKCHRVL